MRAALVAALAAAACATGAAGALLPQEPPYAEVRPARARNAAQHPDRWPRAPQLRSGATLASSDGLGSGGDSWQQGAAPQEAHASARDLQEAADRSVAFDAARSSITLDASAQQRRLLQQQQQPASASDVAQDAPAPADATAAASGPASAAGPVSATESDLSDEQQRVMVGLLADHTVSGSSWRSDRVAHRMDHDISA